MSAFSTIYANDGTAILVDTEDYSLLNRHNWYIKSAESTTDLSYAVTQAGVKHLNMHKLIMGAAPQSAFEIDHINHNGLDNRKQNLRFVPKTVNSHNKRKRRNTFSIYKGVCRKSAAEPERWQATIRLQNKQYYLGTFNSEIEAARAYDKAAEKFYGPIACPNFPQEEKCQEN